MILVKNKVFTITTANTSYIMHVRNDRYVENLYYGRRRGTPVLTDNDTVIALSEKFTNPYGNTINAMGEETNVTLDNICLETSNVGTGDYRIAPFIIEDEDGCISTRFYFHESLLYDGLYVNRNKTGMPHARWTDDENVGSKPQTLELIFTDNNLEGVELRLIYTSFDDCDTITRRTVLINKGKKTLKIRSISSLMLDIPQTDYTLVTFDGIWTRERHKKEKELVSGVYEMSSNVGTSSNIHNPFMILRQNEATEDYGNCYAFNLIYSGNHKERVEVSEYRKIRVTTGINDHSLCYNVAPGETFYSPEAVMTFSNNGMNGVSHNCHRFVMNHIVRSDYRTKPRPILINNWEATYFDFNKRKLTALAKDAAELGIELFVLDDGWFGDRDSDTTALGDWFVNEKKLGGPLKDLIAEINKLGLSFGIWIEPEMISEKSELYKKHPEWAVRAEGRDHYLGRNQMVLDYTNKDVRDYIVDCISTLLRENAITYIKWDMNRYLTDTCGAHGEFFHRYTLGFYDVLGRLTEEFPDVLFEGCSAGGNRFDLGVLYFMPQIWTSDDTDANERVNIQGGTSYGYPQSTMGSHVSAAPNHQTLRNISLGTRFHVAAMGVLGYELDLTSLTPLEKKTIREQIEFYKEYRELLQFGEFTRVKKYGKNTIWQITSSEHDKAICLLYKEQSEPNQSYDMLYAKDLDEDAVYNVKVRNSKVSIKEFGNLINQISPIKIKEEGIIQAAISRAYALDSEVEEYTVSGATLMYAGIKLNSRFIGTGLNDGTRVMGDYSSRLYTINKV